MLDHDLPITNALLHNRHVMFGTGEAAARIHVATAIRLARNFSVDD
jgi:hypothetical protein